MSDSCRTDFISLSSMSEISSFAGKQRLDLVKHLMMKIYTTLFDDSMSSFSIEKRIKFDNLIYTVRGDKT